MKTCTKCKIEKPIGEFHKRNARPCGTGSHCKSCRCESEKERFKKNAERLIAQKRIYNEANREKINKRQHKYNQENKEMRAKHYHENKARYAEYRRWVYKTNHVFSMSDRIRRRLSKALTEKRFPKNGKTEYILGCSFKELCEHLEAQFKEGMCWDNRGEWEIDHIIPYKVAKTEDHVFMVSYYQNLQPLWAHENRSKSGNVI